MKIKTRSEKERPRSCVEACLHRPTSFKLGEDDIVKKRWSGIALNSKLYQAYDRLAKEDEEYTDSLENPVAQDRSEESNSNENVPSLREEVEPESLDSNFSDEKPLNGKRFKRLQQKWEMLSGQNSSESPPLSPTHGTNKSKIPRPITSPIRPSGIPVPVSPTLKGACKTVKKVTTPPSIKNTLVNKAFGVVKNSPMKKAVPSTR